MNVEKTPTKRVPQAKKGRKRKAEASQFCRVCHRSFQSKAGYISTENIFQIPKKKGLNKTLESYLVDDLGFSVETGELLSTRLCSTCGSKVRAAAVTISILKSNLNKPAPCIVQEENVERTKRMSRSPHHTQQCKAPKPSSCPKKTGVRRSLPLGIANENVVPTKPEELHIDLQGISNELTTLQPEQQQKTEFNVLEKDPNAQVKDKTPTNAASRSLIKNIVNLPLVNITHVKTWNYPKGSD